MEDIVIDRPAEGEDVRLTMERLLAGISSLIGADAYFVSEMQGNEELVAHTHHAGEPILHCGLAVSEPEENAQGEKKWLGRFYCSAPVGNQDGSSGSVGLLRRETSFTDMEKAILELAVSRWTTGTELELAVQEKKVSSGRMTADDAALPKMPKPDTDRLYELGLEMITPMTGITGMAEMLAETELTDEQRSYVDTIVGSSRSLVKLIQEMMTSSGSAAGLTKKRSVEFSLHMLLAELAAGMHGMMDLKLLISCGLDPELPLWIVGDEEMLREVLIGLLQAVSKDVERESAGTRVLVKSRSMGNGLLDLLVTITHAQEAENRIQASSVIRDRIEAMGGELWFESHESSHSISFTIQVWEGVRTSSS